MRLSVRCGIDHDGNVWVGTNLGLARLSGDRWVTAARRRQQPGPRAVPV